MPEVIMPRLSDSMEEGTIIGWLKRDGDLVTVGDELVEIETDKATMVYAAEDEGVLEIFAAQGATVPVGGQIAVIGHASGVDAFEADGAGPNGHPRGDRVKASPLARRIAAQLGIEIVGLTGTGPGGRIVKADVLAEAASATAPANAIEPEPEPAAAATNLDGDTVQPLTRLQQTVALRMSATRAEVPDFTVSADVDAGALTRLRAELKAAAAEGDPVPSVNDMIVKASALALRKHPRANASYDEGNAVLHSQINVGIAVAGEGTLIVPVIADADLKSLGRIALESRRLVERARQGTIAPPELSGGTFTVSNLGMFGMFDCTPVINGRQAAILGVGGLRQEPVVVDGELAVGWRIRLTLVGDHRLLYGADAAQFLATIRSTLEQPLMLAL
jgi:pyruvate dehydrogenase E2 component (dihydrolipoamide acetyltransferase)